jgi:hypothetical protein
MNSKTTKEKSKLKDLWMLLFEDPLTLTDEQVSSLLEAKDELKKSIRRLEGFPYNIERVQNYRKRRKELSEMSTEELTEKSQEISKHRASVLASSDERDIEDSFFEPAPFDSDERILYELLKERGAIK